MATEFEKAVEATKKWLQSTMDGRAGGLAADRNLANADDFDAINAAVLGSAMLRNDPEALLAWAKTDRKGFDTLRLGIAATVEYHPTEKLHPEVRAWLARFLRNKVNRPAVSAGRREESGRKFLIWAAVSMLVERGMMATRNDASEAISACDAVAEALAALGMEPQTFYGVKRVWLEGKRNEKPSVKAT